MTKSFKDLGLSHKTLETLDKLGFKTPFPVQERSIPMLLAGKNVGAKAKTGSGKTLAYAIPIAELVERKGYTQVLVMAPTRELAIQNYQVIKKVAPTLKFAIIYGGVGYQSQFQQLETADVVIGTPGRLIDHIQRNTLKLQRTKIVVLDEADRMLDMGFKKDVERIMRATTRDRRVWLFSATLHSQIVKLGRSLGVNEFVETGEDLPSEIDHFFVDYGTKLETIRKLIESHQKILMFTNTKHFARKISTKLKIPSIHGDMSQNARERSLKQFINKSKCLVATDVAARGLDIPNVDLVINVDIPKDSKDYIHRTGRTGRAGNKGRVINILSPKDFDVFRRITSELKLDVGPWRTKR